MERKKKRYEEVGIGCTKIAYDLETCKRDSQYFLRVYTLRSHFKFEFEGNMFDKNALKKQALLTRWINLSTIHLLPSHLFISTFSMLILPGGRVKLIDFDTTKVCNGHCKE